MARRNAKQRKHLSRDERWSVIDYMGLRGGSHARRHGRSVARTARRFGVHERTIKRLVALYNESHAVVRVRRHGPEPRMTEPLKHELFTIIVSSPRKQLKENLIAFTAGTGIRMHLSSFSKTVKRLGFSRKKLRAFARKRDAAAALAFKSYLVANFMPDWLVQCGSNPHVLLLLPRCRCNGSCMLADPRGFDRHCRLFFLDETSKDRTSMRRDWGYALRGLSPVDTNGYVPRSTRCSSLCGFDVDGFVNWYTIRDTFNRARFLEACEHTVVRSLHCSHWADCGRSQPSTLPPSCGRAQFPYITPFPGPRSVVILDNASIHHCFEFVLRVNQLGGMVLFTPPYCFDTTPLDNGAFGLVKLYLQVCASGTRTLGIERAAHTAMVGGNLTDLLSHGLQDRSEIFDQMSLERALDYAFESVTPGDARYCFRQCGYL
jgi:transposase